MAFITETNSIIETPIEDIKVLSFNIHKGVHWLARKSTIEQIREQIWLLHPEIVFLQESFGTQFQLLAGEIWPYFSYGKNAVYVKGHHGNAILSKYPILFSENISVSMGIYERRGFLHCIVHPVSLPYPLHLLCVHLGLFKNDRKKQLATIVSYIEHHIPDNEFLIIGGDFNDWLNQATEPLIKGLGLKEAFLHHHGGYAKTFPSWHPFLKLDRVYMRGFKTAKAERLVERSWKSLSDHIALSVHLKLEK